MERSPCKGVCIDLDGTLGNFDGIKPPFAQSRDEVEIWEAPKLRPDLTETLQYLVGNGFRIAVTSGREIYPLLVALEQGEIIDFVDKPFGGRSLDYSRRVGGKDYSKVAEHFNFLSPEANSNMIVIGDDEKVDTPKNPDGLVFICQPLGYSTTALLWSQIINELLEKGQGNFRKGYDKMFNLGKETIYRVFRDQHDKVVKYPLSPKVDLYLETRSRHPAVKTPTIAPILH